MPQGQHNWVKLHVPIFIGVCLLGYVMHVVCRERRVTAEADIERWEKSKKAAQAEETGYISEQLDRRKFELRVFKGLGNVAIGLVVVSALGNLAWPYWSALVKHRRGKEFRELRSKQYADYRASAPSMPEEPSYARRLRSKSAGESGVLAAPPPPTARAAVESGDSSVSGPMAAWGSARAAGSSGSSAMDAIPGGARGGSSAAMNAIAGPSRSAQQGAAMKAKPAPATPSAKPKA